MPNKNANATQWRESNRFRLDDLVIASPSISTLGWAGKRTGVIVGQGREPGTVRIRVDGSNEAQTWWEGFWLLRDSPETTKVLENFKSAVQQTADDLRTYLKSDPQARTVLREAMRLIEEEERREFAEKWIAEHPNANSQLVN